MSFFTTLKRVFRNSLQHIGRNFSHSVTAVLVMALTLFMASLLGLILVTSDRILSHLENKLEVTAFFTENTTEEYILDVQRELAADPRAEEVRYISQKEALEIYRQQNTDTPELLEFVTADILPASLSVSATNVDSLGFLAERLANDERVEKVIYQEDVVSAFNVWSNRIRLVGLVLSGFLIAVAILILLVVVSLNISDFGREIEIMRLVGASTWYIRWPFMLDGLLYGLISAVIATTGVYVLIPYIEQFVGQLVSGVDLFPNVTVILLYTLVGNAALGMLLGIIGSTIAIYRHLRV